MKNEFKIIANIYQNNILKEKTIFYFKEENEMKKFFNNYVKELINNKFEIDIYNKTNHIQALYKSHKIDITTSNLPL